MKKAHLLAGLIATMAIFLLATSGNISKTEVSHAAPATFTVTKVADTNDGTCDADCSLREAMAEANDNDNDPADTDTIAFDIAGCSIHTIAPTSSLPLITEPVNIDGETQNTNQACTAGSHYIEIDGTSAGGVSGFSFNTGSNGSTINGLVINNFSGSAVAQEVTINTITVTGSFIGLDPDGSTIQANGNGVVLDLGGSDHVIGGNTSLLRNVISGNTTDGIKLDGTGVNPITATIKGNYIGTDSAGTADKANGVNGLNIASDSTVAVGGTIAADRNIISGNTTAGINFTAGPTTSTIQGNYIGTNVSGTAALANGTGIRNAYAGGKVGGGTITIGGTTVGAGNLISGNSGNGLTLDAMDGGNPVAYTIQRNIIGLNFTATAGIPNSYGITVDDADDGTSDSVLIGGQGTGTLIIGASNYGNIISANTNDGIEMNADDVEIKGNTISYNNNGINTGDSDNLLIGGIGTDEGNVIVNNAVDGIQVIVGEQDTTTGIQIFGNWIGIDKSDTDLGNGANGISIQDGATVTIGGSTSAHRNIISGNDDTGIYIVDGDGGDNVTIQGNYVGTNAAGTAAIDGHDTAGISAYHVADLVYVVGGSGSGEGNVVSGNNGVGIYHAGEDGDSGNTVTIQGNYVGTNAAGTAAIGNAGKGIQIAGADDDSVDTVQIGGTTGVDVTGPDYSCTGACNLISGNGTSGADGLETGPNATVEGNYIGTDITGMSAITNSTENDGYGANISGDDVTFGGTTAAARNIVSGNYSAMIISGNSNSVLGNYIGVAADGTTALANTGDASGIFVLGDTNIIGNTSGGGNTIANNQGNGIFFAEITDFPVTPNNNQARGNSIYNNGQDDSGLGIDIASLTFDPFNFVDIGPTPNDPGDSDTGPQNYQNYPEVSYTEVKNGKTDVVFELDSTSETNFDIDFYSNTTLNNTGVAEGEEYVGSITVNTKHGPFRATLNTKLIDGVYLTATATGSDGTSEFSEGFLVLTGPQGSGGGGSGSEKMMKSFNNTKKDNSLNIDIPLLKRSADKAKEIEEEMDKELIEEVESSSGDDAGGVREITETKEGHLQHVEYSFLEDLYIETPAGKQIYAYSELSKIGNKRSGKIIVYFEDGTDRDFNDVTLEVNVKKKTVKVISVNQGWDNKVGFKDKLIFSSSNQGSLNGTVESIEIE